MNQYDIKFTQLSRYARKLVCEVEEGTKRLVSELKPEIRSRLVSFQLQVYNKVVESTGHTKELTRPSQKVTSPLV